MKVITTACYCLGLASTCAFGSLLLDDYDSQSLGSGNPTDYIIFGPLVSDRGISNLESASPDQSLYVDVDFSQSGYGAVVRRTLSTPMDLTGTTLSVDLQSDYSFSGGMTALYLLDGDGTTYISETADYYTPTSSFSTFSQNVSDITLEAVAGSTAGLDLTNITAVGFQFVDTSDTTTERIYADNLQVIPEPSTMVLMGAALGALYLSRRRKTA